MSLTNFIENKKVEKIVPLIIIFFVGLGFRIYYFPHELPLVVDSLSYFLYSTETVFLGHLPTTWTPINNGWPIFNIFWFSIIDLENTLEYMQLQRTISVLLSSFTVIPVYFLCRKFFDHKLSIIGASIFIFDPRIILNSLLGITEPIFILLSTTALVFFLKYKRKEIIFSFILVSFCTTIRSEGIFLFLALTIIFFIKFKISKEIIKTYLPGLIIFILILIPIMDYRIEITGSDGIFLRAIEGSTQTITTTNQDLSQKIFEGGKLFATYLGWIMIPVFIIFLPFGIIQFLRKKIENTSFIITFLIISSIPIFYAYLVQAQDTRYLYVLYPIFCVLSLFAVQSYISKINKKNIVIFVMILGILSSSIIFYELKKTDYDKERELYEIGKIASKIILASNGHPTESRYISVAQIPNEWPFVFHDDMYMIERISIGNSNNLEDYILNSRDELTHIIVDDNPDLPEFLQDVNKNEEKYQYLKKIFDSKNNGFNHQIKIFEIDYKQFDLMN
ncbi:glycosyltransferase family 39 protein [Nitrosopumilus sp.]|nr:glycosyltransferase family 39 protein [Nitrosopumilus sp.]|tara:strand:- start:6669 stop:8183 length:1515 start_codon:yes stop_codon:yes gene_type:complete